MRKFLILAVAASFAVACAGRTEEEVGAAPDQGDTTAVAADTMQAVPSDTTMGQTETDTSFVQQDTTGVTADTSYVPMESDTLSQQDADTSAAGEWSDTTAAMPSDTTAEPTDTTAQPNQ